MRKVNFNAGQLIIFFVEGAFFGKVLVCLWGKLTLFLKQKLKYQKHAICKIIASQIVVGFLIKRNKLNGN